MKMKDFLKLLSKEELIEAINQNNLTVNTYDCYTIIHKKLMKRLDVHVEGELSKNYNDFKKNDKEYDKIMLAFDKLEKLYELVSI